MKDFRKSTLPFPSQNPLSTSTTNLQFYSRTTTALKGKKCLHIPRKDEKNKITFFSPIKRYSKPCEASSFSKVSVDLIKHHCPSECLNLTWKMNVKVFEIEKARKKKSIGPLRSLEFEEVQ